jgi:hypothetical protein
MSELAFVSKLLAKKGKKAVFFRSKAVTKTGSIFCPSLIVVVTPDPALDPIDGKEDELD